MIGDIIKELRREKGWTQKELANKIRTSESSIKMIETNKNGLSASILPKLAEVLEVTTEFLEKKQEENKIDSFTIELLEKLVYEGMIEDVNNIKEEELNLIIAAVKMDLRRIKKGI